MRNLLADFIWILWLFCGLSDAIKCYSCANEFIVWQWRHLFLKRNYEVTASDSECVLKDFKPESFQPCHSSCFILLINGTDRETGYTKNLGVGRGCSSHFLTDDQHMHLGLGTNSKISEIGEYLPHDFDKMEITEHWCFCATDKCNSHKCFSSPFGSYDYANSYIAKRLQYSSYSSNGWRYRNTGYQLTLMSQFIVILSLLYL
ncbi:unnamed protein product [Auanema sp. JU1783]|nr:unnamed protein product [Auanema sp. JU1783]